MELLDRVTNLESSVGALQVSVGTLQVSVGALQVSVGALEVDMRDVRDRLARVETKIDIFATTFATKEDLHQALNTQTWKLVSFVSAFGTAMVGAVFFIARHSI